MQSLRNVPRGASASHRGSTSHRLLSTGRLQSALLKRSFSSGSARSYVGCSSVPEAGSDGGEVINFARASYYVPAPSTHTGTGEDVPHAGHVPATSSSSAMSAGSAAMSAGTAAGGNNRLARRKALAAEKKYLATRKEAKLNGGVDRYPGAYTFAELDARSDEAIEYGKKTRGKKNADHQLADESTTALYTTTKKPKRIPIIQTASVQRSNALDLVERTRMSHSLKDPEELDMNGDKFSSLINKEGNLKRFYRALLQNKVPPSIHDPPVVRRPGDICQARYVVKNYWAVPATGFNSILQIPIHQFQVWENDQQDKTNLLDKNINPEDTLLGCKKGEVPASASIAIHNHLIANTGLVISRDLSSVLGEAVVPNAIFGCPIRKDIIYKAYWWFRGCLAGYDRAMQLNKWDWPGNNKKFRSQIRSGKARMSARVAHTSWEGAFVHPITPRIWRRQVLNRKQMWIAQASMLSAKFAQGEIKIVDDFNIKSHKTKHVVQCFRRLVGDRCNSALCVHEGIRDVNDNFRWATGHIAMIRRCNVEGLNVYNMLKYRYLIMTELALQKLIHMMQNYATVKKWGPQYATPDGRRCRHTPQKVPGWNKAWIERKERLRNAEFRHKILSVERKKWKWSLELKGPLKVRKDDPLTKFRLMNMGETGNMEQSWRRLEDLYIDSEPLGEQIDEEDQELNLDAIFDQDSGGMNNGNVIDASSLDLNNLSGRMLNRRPQVQMIDSKEDVGKISGFSSGQGSALRTANKFESSVLEKNRLRLEQENVNIMSSRGNVREPLDDGDDDVPDDRSEGEKIVEMD